MATEKTGNGASPRAAPMAEPKQEHMKEEKTAASSKAAREAPKETRAAARNAFGDVPKGGDAWGSNTKHADAPRTSVAAPKDAPRPQNPNTPARATNASPGRSNDAQPKTYLTLPPGSPNGGLPESAPPTDPKAGAAETPLVAPEVDKALSTPGANGKTVTEDVLGKTMEDLKKHVEELKKNNLPADAVARYFKLKQAETLIRLGIPTGKDPKDPTVPAVPGTPGEASTSDIFDAKKIERALKVAEADPEVQKWIAERQSNNQEALLEERIKKGEIPDIPRDPVTGRRTDTLKNKQAEHLRNPELAITIARMPADKLAEAIARAAAPFGILGATGKESKEHLYNLIDKVTDITGAPKPLVDGNFDLVTTPAGEMVIKDPASGKGVALDKTGKVVTDANTNLPITVGTDGNQEFDPLNRPVVITRSGYTAVQDENGTMLVVGTDKYGNENIPLRSPVNSVNSIIIDKLTDLPVEVDAKTGLPLADAKTGLPKVVDVTTGNTVTNPATGNPIVADKVSGTAVEVDAATGKIIADAQGNPVVVDPTTGYRVQDASGNLVVMDTATKVPVFVDPKTGIKIIANPKTGRPMLDPLKGTTAILDPESKLPIAAVTSKETGEIIKNTNGQIVQLDEQTGLPVLVDPTTDDRSIVDPATGLVLLDPRGNSLYVDKSTGLPVAKDAAGKDVIEWRSHAKLIYDPKTGIPIGADEAGTVLAIDPRTNLPVEVDFATYGAFTKDANGHTVVMNPATGKQQMTPDGKGVVVDPKAVQAVAIIDGKNFVVNPYTGEYLTDKDTGAKVIVDPKTNALMYQDPVTGDVYQDPVTGGYQIIDPLTGGPLKDVDDNAIQIDPKTGAPAVWDAESGAFKATAPLPVPVTDAEGNPVTTADGNILAKDGATGNHILLDPATHRPVDGPKAGMPQLVDQNGTVIKDASGNFVVQDKESGLPVALDVSGNAILDVQGNALVYNLQGKQVIDANGNPVVIDKNSGATILTTQGTGAPIVDKAGNVYVANPETGGAIVDPQTGNVAVLDKESKAPVVAGADGTVYKDASGNAYLADLKTATAKTDEAGNFIMVDKNVGMPVVVDPKTGIKTMVDNTGEPIRDPKSGATYEVGKNGMPQLVLDNGNGERIVIDPQTGKQMEIDGNKVYIDPETGMTVMNHPVYGTVDVISGKTPEAVIDGALPLYGEKADKIWKAVRAGIGSVYWNTFGVVGAKFSQFANDPFFQNTKNFHASRMVATASGIGTMVMSAIRWAPGTAMYDKLASGDPKTVALFTEDMAANMKYFGFYPKTTEGFMKYFFSDPVIGKFGVKLAGDNKTLYRPGPGGSNEVFVPKGGVNPFTGNRSETGGWVQAPADSFTPDGGVVNPLAAPPDGNPAPGAVRPVSDPTNAAVQGYERWDAQTRTWVYVGKNPTGLPPGVDDPNYFNNRSAPPDPTSTLYSRFTASKLFNIIKTSANFLMGLGNTIGGALQTYRGGAQIHEAIKSGNAALGVAGGFNVIAGGAYIVTGVAGMLSALGVLGAIGGTIAGVGLAIGNLGTLIALVVELTSDPNGMKHPSEVWANKVTDEFKDVDVFTPDANKLLQEWFRKFATDYWAMKQAEDSLYAPRYDA